MLLGNFIKNINRKYYKTYFSGIAFNSKQVKKDNIFFAIEGTKLDGNEYIFDAINNGAKIIISKKNIKFRDGSSFKDACKIISEIKKITTFGVNCFSPKLVESAIKELKKYSKKKVLVYPNSGEEYNPRGRFWSGKNEFNDLMIKNWLSLSPDIIGGCCRVGYDNIKKMREEIDNHNLKK